MPGIALRTAPGVARKVGTVGGPVLGIELPGAVTAEPLARLGEILAVVSDRFRQKRPGSFDLSIDPAGLGITDVDRDGSRFFLVYVSGPGFGDEDTFDSEHADGPDLKPLIGFTPTHGVTVAAMGNGQVDHLLTAELTARVQEVVGGVINAEVDEEQIELVRGLPGVIAVVDEPWECALGTAEFLRGWAASEGFRLVK